MVTFGNTISMAEHKLTSLDKRIIIFAGGYGSGKTEVAVNFAIYMARQGNLPLSIVDLDIVNPYFRSREAARPLKELGINVIIPEGEQCSADLPIILPQVKGSIENENERVILDVGGDDVGARVMSSMADAFKPGDYEMLFVLNANRPFTSDLKSSIRMKEEIETACRLKFTGLVSNTHLIDETDEETILKGLNLANEISEASRIPVKFISAKADVLNRVNPEALNCPVLPLERYMLKPWELKAK
jgi:hypothetical protein